MNEPLLTIANVHAAESGTPPKFANDVEGRYVGYFENVHGEQWVFTHDRGKNESRLWGGDVGWGESHLVEATTVDALNLSQDESLWLLACCAAAAPTAKPTGLVNAVVKRLVVSRIAEEDEDEKP